MTTPPTRPVPASVTGRQLVLVEEANAGLAITRAAALRDLLALGRDHKTSPASPIQVGSRPGSVKTSQRRLLAAQLGAHNNDEEATSA